MPIFKTEALSCYLTTAVLNDYYSEAMAYTALASSVFTCMDAKVTPTGTNDYSCHVKP